MKKHKKSVKKNMRQNKTRKRNKIGGETISREQVKDEQFKKKRFRQNFKRKSSQKHR
jgi:hypothetical protein